MSVKTLFMTLILSVWIYAAFAEPLPQITAAPTPEAVSPLQCKSEAIQCCSEVGLVSTVFISSKISFD